MKLKLINSLTRNRRWRRLSWKKSRDKSEHSSHWWEKNIIKIWFLLKNILDFLFIVKNISHHKCFYSLSSIFPITNVSVLTAESKNHFDLIYCFPSTFVKNTSSPYSNVTSVTHYCVLHFFWSLICLGHSIQIKHISIHHTVKQYVWLFSDTSLSSIGGLGYSISSSFSSLPQTPPDSSSPRWDIT